MNKQRGIAIDLILYGLAALAALGALYGIYSWIDHSWETSAGIARGEKTVRAQWDEANRRAEAEAQAEMDKRARIAALQSAQLHAADGRARDAETRWRQARSEADRAKIPLLVADCPGQAGSVAETASGGSGLRRPDPAVRFSYQFVREFQSGWTGTAGEPLFDYPLGPPEAPGTASPIDAEAVLANAEENASRCSAGARQLNSLIDLLERLRAQ